MKVDIVGFIRNIYFYTITFVIIGIGVYAIIPASYYYRFENLPLPVDKDTYSTCEPIIRTFIRNSRIDTNGSLSLELVSVKDGSAIASRSVPDFQISKGYDANSPTFPIPCQLPKNFQPGEEYYIRGVTTFFVHNFVKNYVFETESFIITDSLELLDK